MKKYLFVSLTILFAAAFVWAEEATIQEPKIDIEADATVSWGVDFGSGTGKLEDRAMHGFNNAASWKVKFPLIKKGDKTSAKSDVPVYAEVTLKDIELNIQSKHDKNDKKFALDGKVDKLKAKLVFYGAYLQVFNKPGFTTNYANLWEPLKKSDNYDDVEDIVTSKFEPGFKGYGTKIGYANKNFMDLDVGLKFGSNGNWDSKPEDDSIDYTSGDGFIYNETEGTEVPKGDVWVNVATNTAYFGKGKLPKDGPYLKYKAKKGRGAWHSKYGFGLDFSMKPLDKMLGIKFNINSTFVHAKNHDTTKGYNNLSMTNQVENSVAFNIGAEVTSEPIDALKLKLGFDGGSLFHTGNYVLENGTPKNSKAFLWDMLFDTQYKWVGGGLYVASAGTAYQGLASKETDTSKLYIPDMATYVKFETKGDKKEASYLLEGLDAGIHLGFYDLLTFANKHADVKWQVPMLMKLDGSYKVTMKDSMWIKPFATLWVETNHWENKTTTVITNPYVGVAYNIGVTYSPAEKVEVTAEWSHGTLNKNKFGGNKIWKGLLPEDKREGFTLIKAPANYNAHNGKLVISVKVKY